MAVVQLAGQPLGLDQVVQTEDGPQVALAGVAFVVLMSQIVFHQGSDGNISILGMELMIN
ncbi:hypothetical protein BIV60_10190 [Bacillus sp. MUM 116]|nr:hypothetical protein BIV60_10190 [Bacillus sp. MUM 116]